MENKKLIVSIILLVIMIGLVGYTIAQSVVNRQVQQTGIISGTPNIQVYSDQACTNIIAQMNWGTVDSPSTNNQIIYVKNIGTTPITLTYDDSPPPGYSTAFNQTNTALSVNQSVAAKITLTVESDLIAGATFDFNITIIGTA